MEIYDFLEKVYSPNVKEYCLLVSVIYNATESRQLH